MHQLIVGRTGSGKSTLLREMMRCYRQRGIPTLAFSTVRDLEGHADAVHYDVDTFMEHVFASQRCAVFVDESGEVTGRSRITETAPLATRTRHLGHVVHFAAQRASGLVGPIVRDQCTGLYVFRVSLDDAKGLARDWGHDASSRAALLGAPSLGQGAYLAVRSWPARCELRQLDFPSIYGRVA